MVRTHRGHNQGRQSRRAQGKNLVITHEPTVYNHEDKTQDF
jgi:hypothetical protein